MGFPGGGPPNMQGGPRPVMIPGMPPVSMEPPQHLDDSEPPNKRARTEDNLIPEADFLQRHNVSFYPKDVLYLCFDFKTFPGSHHDSSSSTATDGKSK